MEAMVDFDERVMAARDAQRLRVSNLALIGALLCILSAAWYVFPALDGDAVLMSRLGPLVLLGLAAFLLQDLMVWDAHARSRIGAACAMTWPVLAVAGAGAIDTTGSAQMGHLLLLVTAGAGLAASHNILQGEITVRRWRGMTSVGGVTIGAALLLSGIEQDTNAFLLGAAILGLALADAGMALFTGDDQKADRKRFGQDLDKLELRILKVQAKGVRADQAASLTRNARAVGFRDPERGFELLRQAVEDLERTLALSEDISAIRAACQAEVDAAAAVSSKPTKPKRYMNSGDRERELGSLREAESLYRRAKKHASEIIAHWERAEAAIEVARELLADQDGTQHAPLRKMLEEAELMLAKEKPLESAGIAETIPDHVGNLAEAEGGADEAIAAARAAIEEAEGLDLTLWEARILEAEEAQAAGDYSLARGHADGILREVTAEREAMGEVQRALRQRKQIAGRWDGHAEAEAFDARLDEVDAAVKDAQWTHAAVLLERLTADLDALEAASGDAGDLLAFVVEEWQALRKKLEARGITAQDGERAAAEQAVALAKEAHEARDVESCLAKLGEADALMEKLARRV